jgi:hypothetical protein
MKAQLKQYVDLLFAGTPDSDDMKQEILQNTLDRYDDLISQGKSPEAAYRLAISGIGDINEMVGNRPAAVAPTAEVIDPEKAAQNKKMRAVAIGLYICCVIPVLVLGNVGNGVLGVCLMFVMIAAATVLMVLSSGSKEDTEEKEDDEPKTELGKAIKSIWGILTLGIYLVISFWSGAWFITWLIFPIMGAVQGLVKAIIDLKEAK